MQKIIKPKRLHPGDKAAIVSPSAGILGDKKFIHKYELGRKRLADLFGIEAVPMPNALKGSEFLYNHPEKRADDLMSAFEDSSISAIITAIGGEDGVRLLPFIDYDVIRNNPKILLGFSDTNVNHFMMYKAGVVSFYGPALITDFAEYGAMNEYTENAVRRLLFDAEPNFEIAKCPYKITKEIPWSEKNINKFRPRVPDERGIEVIQGSGKTCGHLLGGCIDAFPMYNGTSVWPPAELWNGAIIFLETSIDCPTPAFLGYYLRNLGAQGILQKAKGIIVGKPAKEKFYEEYKPVYLRILREFGREDMPVLYNLNFGHSSPIGIIPYGIQCEIDADAGKVRLLENAVI